MGNNLKPLLVHLAKENCSRTKKRQLKPETKIKLTRNKKSKIETKTTSKKKQKQKKKKKIQENKLMLSGNN